MAVNKWIRSFFEYTYRNFAVDNSSSWQIGFRAYPKNTALDYVSASYNSEDGYAGKFQDIYLKSRVTLNSKLSFSSRLTVYLYSNKADDRVFLPAFSLDPAEAEILYERDRRDNSFSFYVSSQYNFTPRISALAGIDYSRTPYLNHDVRGVLKFTYRFWSPIIVKGGDAE
ncbi:MAG: hypothetical protein A2161_21645 [Candidatus Schekmanbacteria bacterium RBG_13_48_7]|uniref:Uncharacterized protein n=1 Tax=Candidatus Schekmanbacteria bacterium RBG_13_48_7 TaxID=1817878 RepID=A0A1F7RUT2_9BACT|nr:MAG: hypothetical protein A2161_21645 [Candidatus Schekmanbacteria bacterium RBG_13_48_7]